MIKIKMLFIVMVVLFMATTTNSSYPIDDNTIIKVEEIDQELDSWYYAYSMANIFNPHWRSKRIANVIIETSKEFNLDPYMVTRQCYKESYMIHWKQSTNESGKLIAAGLFMVRPKFWTHVLYKVDDGKLGKHLKANPEEDPLKYFFRIGYNAEMYGKIYTHYLKKNEYNHALALTEYWAGKNSPEMKSFLKGGSNHYVNEILYGHLEKEILTKVKGRWKYYENRYDTFYIRDLKGEEHFALLN